MFIEYTREQVEHFRRWWAQNKVLSLDTETTGLMPYHGDRVFAVTLSDGDEAYYFDTSDEKFPSALAELFHDENRLYLLHNPCFDLHALWNTFGVLPKGKFFDTVVGARLEFNDHLSYSLSECAKRIGLQKSTAVEEYITKHRLFEKVKITGKKTLYTKKFFHKVPKEIMFEYACQDALVTYKLGAHQRKKITEIDSLFPAEAAVPRLADVAEMEAALVPVIFALERGGVKIDPDYCSRGIAIYEKQIEDCQKEFKEITSQDYKASPKLFAEIFAAEKERWEYTEKGNPSFESATLKRLDHRAAAPILGIRNAKSRQDFFHSFLFYSDRFDYVHPAFKSGGTTTGRFASAEPNFQNLTGEDAGADESIRRAIIAPSPEFCILSIDYDQQEYRLLLDYAGEMEVIEKVKSGVDVHQAMADMVGVTRAQAKTLNFGLLYGMGTKTLAGALGLTEDAAKELRSEYFSRLPRVSAFLDKVKKTAEARGYVYNWAGRRYWCADRRFSYTMPNRIIQGGGADIMKHAMVKIHELLAGLRSRMIITIHDELDFYLHRKELDLVAPIKQCMESVFPSRFLPLTTSVSHSWKSLGDLIDGAPEKQVAGYGF